MPRSTIIPFAQRGNWSAMIDLQGPCHTPGIGVSTCLYGQRAWPREQQVGLRPWLRPGQHLGRGWGTQGSKLKPQPWPPSLWDPRQVFALSRHRWPPRALHSFRMPAKHQVSLLSLSHRPGCRKWQGEVLFWAHYGPWRALPGKGKWMGIPSQVRGRLRGWTGEGDREQALGTSKGRALASCGEETGQTLKVGEGREQKGVPKPSGLEELVLPTWGLSRFSQHPAWVSFYSER